MIKLHLHKSNSVNEILRWLSLLLLILSVNVQVNAQLEISTDRNTSVYEQGENVRFWVQSSVGGSATYSITYDRYADTLRSGTLNLQPGIPQAIAFTAPDPALVLCTVVQNGQLAKAAAAVDPLRLQVPEEEPADFDAFWADAKAELASISLDPRLTLHSNTAYSSTYKINLATVAGRRVYGYLSIPAGSGPFPAILTLPAFGTAPNVVVPEPGLAEKGGAISMTISIHNAEPDQSDANAYQPDDITDPDQMYDKLAVLAGIRAIDYLFSRPDFDGLNLGVGGVSQGGGLAMMVAGIDQRVKLLLHSNSTHCQHSGLKYGKASGFPYYLNRSRTEVGTAAHEQATLRAAKYFDAVYFARRYHGPSLTVISYKDEVCPAATVFAAFNELKGPRILVNTVELGHIHPVEYWNGRFDLFRRHFPAMQNPPWPWPDTGTGYSIDAGPDRTIATGDQLSLSASTTLDNSALNDLPVSWTLLKGPGTVSFDDAATYNPSATFSRAGVYTLRFTAHDYQQLTVDSKFYTLVDELEVTVRDDGDTIPPQVLLSTPATEVSTSFRLTVSASEPISGLELSDLEITNGTAANLSGNGQVFTVAITPVTEGIVRIKLPAGRVQDLAGNSNAASNQLEVNFKPAGTIPPTVTLSTAITVVSGPFEVQLAFSEPVTGLEAADFILSNAMIDEPTGSGSTYRLSVSPLAPGQVSVALAAQQVVDEDGNGNEVSNLLQVTYITPGNEVLVLNATGAGRTVQINWATNTEYKNLRFELERSVNNADYEPILMRDSENSGNLLYNYTFTDLAPESGENYYRVRQIFSDSSFNYSNIQRVEIKVDLDALVIFPNPAPGRAFVSLRALAGRKGELEVRNQQGALVLFRRFDELPAHPLEINLEGFQNGIYYFLFSIKGTKRFSRKLILMR